MAWSFFILFLFKNKTQWPLIQSSILGCSQLSISRGSHMCVFSVFMYIAQPPETPFALRNAALDCWIHTHQKHRKIKWHVFNFPLENVTVGQIMLSLFAQRAWEWTTIPFTKWESPELTISISGCKNKSEWNKPPFHSNRNSFTFFFGLVVVFLT